MMGPSSQISRILLFVLFLLVIFYIFMDIELYIRIQNYPIERNYHFSNTTNDVSTVTINYDENLLDPYSEHVWVSCNINPLCHVTVKAVLLDHTNHYIFAPLATIFDDIIGFSRSSFITANMISFFHVGVACISGKLVSSDSLGYRRLGVILFQFRTFLDDLDGHVARAKKHIRGERSEVGTAGYYIDGICDGLGCIALLLGIFFYLKNNPPRRGYSQVPTTDTKQSEAVTRPKIKQSTRKVAKKVVSFTGQLLLSSTAWNRYIAVYQEMLERNDFSQAQFIKQNTVFRSALFFCVAWIWRIVNVHSLLHCVLLSIFCDKLWDFLKTIQYSGYVVLLVAICAAEMHILEAHNYIFNSPTYLYEWGWHHKGIIGVTEPRRTAAITLAQRVAYECGEEIGNTVGFVIGLIEQQTISTKIKFMTEGILLREMLTDPLLLKYSVIMIDEVHERNLLTDTLLSLLKKILKKRLSLKLIISSATTDAVFFKKYFDCGVKSKDESSVILSVEGRMHPIKIYYLNEACINYLIKSVETVLQIHKKEAQGDILVFLTGQNEVLQAFNLMNEYINSEKLQNIHIFQMFGTLPVNEQIKAFLRPPKNIRKVIFSTNIAETCVTIPGVVYVVDCGFTKVKWLHLESATNSLVILPISKATAVQRAGRAGRLTTGKVYRLYTEAEFKNFPDRIPPEIRRSDISSVILLLKALGINNILRFDFVSSPPIKNIQAVLETLYALNAIDENCNLTNPVGYTLAEMPFDPMLSKILYISGQMGCSEEILSIVAMLQVPSVFSKPVSAQGQTKARIAKRRFEVAEGDLITLLNVYTAFIENNCTKEFCGKNYLIYRHLKHVYLYREEIVKKVLKKLNIPISSAKGDMQSICKCIAAGFFLNAAYLHHSGIYRKIHGDTELFVSPQSSLYTLPQSKFVVYYELLQTTKFFMNHITVIKGEWLSELAPHYYYKASFRH